MGLQSKGEFTEMIRALKRENVALMADQGLRLYNMKQKHCDEFFSDCTWFSPSLQDFSQELQVMFSMLS